MKSNDIKKEDLKSENVEYSDILLILAKEIRLILAFPSILILLMMVYLYFFSKPIYISTSKIISSTNSGNSQMSGIASQLGINISSSSKEVNWIYEDIIKSRNLIGKVIKRKILFGEKNQMKSVSQIISGGDNHKAISTLINSISVREDISTGIWTLKVQASSMSLANSLNKLIIDELDSHQREHNNAIKSETRKFIEGRIESTEKELVEAEEMLKEFMESNRRIDNSPSLLLQKNRYQREVTVLIGVFTTLRQQHETAKIEEVKDSNYILIIDFPMAPNSPSKPQKMFLIILTGFFSLIIIVIYIFIKQAYRNINTRNKDTLKNAKIQLIQNIKNIF